MADSCSNDWIELTEEKQFSRLLYPNPVCFLGTTTPPCCQSSRAIPPCVNDEINDQVVNSKDISQIRNVMVLSWLTPTNNHGRFVFSMNKHRHSASILYDSFSAFKQIQQQQPVTRFSLSVPVKKMEELVLAVGGVSGRWADKFPEQTHAAAASLDNLEATPVSFNSTDERIQTNSKGRKQTRRKRKLPRYPLGIPGLEAVAPGSNRPLSDDHSNFAVRGTVAHLECNLLHMLSDDAAIIDKDHYLVSAQVTKAFVRRSHWNADKKLFQPQDDHAPPLLTFLGSQTFGYRLPVGPLACSFELAPISHCRPHWELQDDIVLL
ncbi:hypothetical protein MPSEU_000149200 [Mayamaea pseudoterrestris]|nr:hypothetical protein MPSEU_000149200 [Mayamaea pseudoterrestris]